MSFQHENPTNPKPHKDHDHPTASGSSGPDPKLLGALALAVIIVVFIIANDHETKIKFVVFNWDTTVRWSIFIAILLGIALDRLVIWGMRRRKANDQKARQQQLEDRAE